MVGQTYSRVDAYRPTTGLMVEDTYSRVDAYRPTAGLMRIAVFGYGMMLQQVY